jgi:hypothetical protein
MPCSACGCMHGTDDLAFRSCVCVHGDCAFNALAVLLKADHLCTMTGAVVLVCSRPCSTLCITVSLPVSFKPSWAMQTLEHHVICIM